MLLQSFRKLETQLLAASQFRPIISQIREQHGSLVSGVPQKYGEVIDDAEDYLSEASGVPVQIELGEIVSLGVFQEDPEMIAFATLAKYQVDVDGEIDEYLYAGASAVLLVGSPHLRPYTVFLRYAGLRLAISSSIIVINFAGADCRRYSELAW